MIHNLRGTVQVRNPHASDDWIEVDFTGTYEYTPPVYPSMHDDVGHPAESELTILTTDPPGYESEVFDIVIDDPSRYYQE